MRLTFDLRTTTIDDFRRSIADNDRKYGSHAMSWDGQVCTVGWADSGKKQMGKLGELGQKLKRARETLHAEADKMAAEVDAFVGTDIPQGMEEARSVLAEHKADFAEMRSELRQMTNGGE